jgi:beta-glucosidase
VGDAEFAALLGRPIPPATWDQSKPLELNDTFSQLFYAKSRIGRLVYKILTGKKNKAAMKGKPDLNILFIYNMPFRGIAKMMGGAVDMPMAEALLEIFNGHFCAGLGRLVGAWLKKGRAVKSLKEGTL